MKKKDFDEAVKENIIDIPNNIFGYKIENSSRLYENYYTRETFDTFVAEMKNLYPSAYQSYYRGKRSELREHMGRYGTMPPKMASVASSSRFCYLALRDGADALSGTGNVQFEYECKIKNVFGIAPQLDAYIKNENIFIEVKCHEIFDSHKITMKNKYWNVICGRDNQFGIADSFTSDKETFDIPLSTFDLNKEHSMFDIKQFFCHLLGVASHAGESKKLNYLFFEPETEGAMQVEVERVFRELKQEIEKIFSSAPIRNFCNANHIQLLAVAEKSKTMGPLTIDNLGVLYQ